MKSHSPSDAMTINLSEDLTVKFNNSYKLPVKLPGTLIIPICLPSVSPKHLVIHKPIYPF
jgi:hypothetical protein